MLNDIGKLSGAAGIGILIGLLLVSISGQLKSAELPCSLQFQPSFA